jgi:hypothetical protein
MRRLPRGLQERKVFRNESKKEILISFLNTDWERLETMTDEEIDYSDIPPLSNVFFQRVKLYVPENGN